MNPLLHFWNEQYGIQHPLEADTSVSRFVNRHVVAGVLNAFPRAMVKFFSLSRSELIQRLFVDKEGGSFKALQAIYAYDDPTKRGDLLNRIFMQSPALKAARNRRRIAQAMLRRCLESQSPDRPTLVLAIGGGDGFLEAEVIAGLDRPNIYYCSIDMDERAVEEIGKTLRHYGLEGRGFVWKGAVNGPIDLEAILDRVRQHFDVSFDGIGVAVLHGIAEYLDIGSPSNDTLGAILDAVHHCSTPNGRLLISQTDYHDRVRFAERGLLIQMRLRDLDELSAEIEKAGWQIDICKHEPMGLITMCMAHKPSDAELRRDDSSMLERPHIGRKTAAGRPGPAATRSDVRP